MRAAILAVILLPSATLAFVAPTNAQQLGLGDQEIPSYAAPSYSPVVPGYHPAPVIGGYAPNPYPAYQPPVPTYNPPTRTYIPTCRDSLTGMPVPCQ